jgi:hypothetical protein
VVLVGVLAVTIVAAVVPKPSERAAGPEWAPEVPAARVDCAAADEPERTVIAIAPNGWDVEVPCGRLAG